MLNWCFNSLEVSGSADAVERFVTANMGLPAQYANRHNEKEVRPVPTEKHFCFNALVPTPQEVLDIGFDGHDIIPWDDLMGVYKGIIPPVLDGYHWNVVNWGTKWDIYHDDLIPEVIGWTKGCEEIRFEFETAWSPPIDWLMKVVAMFPELHFKLHYEESGCYFAGDVYGENGSSTIDEYDDARCDALFQYWEDGDGSSYSVYADYLAAKAEYRKLIAKRLNEKPVSAYSTDDSWGEDSSRDYYECGWYGETGDCYYRIGIHTHYVLGNLSSPPTFDEAAEGENA